jgi:hypothetical protein
MGPRAALLPVPGHFAATGTAISGESDSQRIRSIFTIEYPKISFTLKILVIAGSFGNLIWIDLGNFDWLEFIPYSSRNRPDVSRRGEE